MKDRRLVEPALVTTEGVIERALAEDLADAGDVTTDAIVPSDRTADATVVARAEGRIAGLFVAERVFRRLDPDVRFETRLVDGCDAVEGDVLARVRGGARAILTAERTALNFLGRLSGIATKTRAFRSAVGRTPPEIVCSRKTTPGLRGLEKYAVRAGGGKNHRFGLYDAVLVKDNHIAVAGGSVREAFELVRANVGHMVKIQVEVDTLDQLEELLPLGADAVLLDNMSLDDLREAARRCRGRLLTEASGGITLENVREVADCGVDQISLGALTHSAPSLDVALDVEVTKAS
jgi:nicotinate-nucleotide pyrophosphorylase (carboxylating)